MIGFVEHARPLLGFAAGTEETGISKASGARGERVWTSGLELPDKAQAHVIREPAQKISIGDFSGIEHHTEVGRMANVVECRSQFCPYVPGIAGFRETKEVFARGERMRPGITGVELHVIGKALGGAYQQAVVVRGARVLVSPDIGEAIVRHGSDSSWRRSNWRHTMPAIVSRSPRKAKSSDCSSWDRKPANLRPTTSVFSSA